MKQYPSIPRVDQNGYYNPMFNQGFYTFDKNDGSQIRISYSKKTGFYKFGSRSQLLDKNNPILGPAIDIFMSTLSEPLTRIFVDNKWEQVDCFTEFWGKNSLAGQHNPDDIKYTTLFDVSIYKRGMMGPKEFLKHFDKLSIPNFLGIHILDANFIQKVKNSEIEGVTFEGIVAKAGEYKTLSMVKCKTYKWLDVIKQKYGEDEAKKIMES